VFVPGFGNDVLAALEDQAILSLPPPPGGGGRGVRLAFTTDAFVVRPLFFPGGDIGSLAVYGTVNDLAVGGARPLYLSAAFIIEEGLPLTDLQRIVASMRRACDEAGVVLVAGDTKVVDRGKADQVFISTTGVGVVPAGGRLSIQEGRAGGVRNAGPRPAARGQRRKADRRCPAGRCRPGRRRDARPSAGSPRGRDRRSRPRPSRHSHHAFVDRRRAGGQHARRGTIAP